MSILGNLVNDFDFGQAPRPPVVLPVHPTTTPTGTPDPAHLSPSAKAGDSDGRVASSRPAGAFATFPGGLGVVGSVTENVMRLVVRGSPDTPSEEALTAETELTRLYREHYRGLLRLAVLVVHDHGLAEDVVQDAFVAMYQRSTHLRNPHAVLAYLRTTVLNRARSQLRHRGVVRRHLPLLVTSDAQTDRTDTTIALDSLARALAALPTRQREAVVLRHYLDLSERDAAEVMGVSVGAVKSSCSRGLAALTPLMKEDNE